MVRPKKYLGQHILTDENIARKIVSSIPGDTKILLEIGPGTGILTSVILEKSIPNYYLIEIDSESVEFLQQKFSELRNNIILSDFLTFDLNSIFNDHFTIIGNFPYNISSQILFRVLEYRHLVDHVIGMFQKEVAERIASGPGTKKYGILSVLCQAYFEIRYLFTVSENVFYPPPKVKSAVIKLKRNTTKQLACDENLFFQVVKTAFNQRRKTLRNSLKSFGTDKMDKSILQKRAEQLSVEDFIQLTLIISEMQNKMK